MTQIDGKYRLRRELFDIMLPVYAAKTVLMLTPDSNRYSQVAYYVAERITAVEPTAFGGFSLWTMDAGELPESILDHIPLRFWNEALPVPERAPEAGELSESVLLLEWIDADTGLCMGKLRCVERGMESWLETADGCKPLTKECLCMGVESLLKGEF